MNKSLYLVLKNTASFILAICFSVQLSAQNSTTGSSSQNNSTSKVNTSDLTKIIQGDIDITVNSINKNISGLQADLASEKDSVAKIGITKQITEQQKIVTNLKQQTAIINQSDTVTISKASTSNLALAQNLNNEADSILVIAYRKRMEAIKAANTNNESNLLSDVADMEAIAKSKQVEALRLQELSNSFLYLNNSIKIEGIRVIVSNNSSSSLANTLENESAYYFNKAQATIKTIKDDMPDDQKNSILSDITADEQTALQKQANAIGLYSSITPSYASNISKPLTSTPVTPVSTTIVANKSVADATKKVTIIETKPVTTTTVTTSTTTTVANKSVADTTKKIAITETKPVTTTPVSPTSTTPVAKKPMTDTTKKAAITEAKPVTTTPVAPTSTKPMADTTKKVTITETKPVTATPVTPTSTNPVANKPVTDTTKKVTATETKPVTTTPVAPTTTTTVVNKAVADTTKKVIITELKPVTTTPFTPISVTTAAKKPVTDATKKVTIAETKPAVTPVSGKLIANDFKGVYLTGREDFSPLNVDDDNLIPLNPSLPSGVVFKVQICAVKRHVEPEAFSGITPVTGEVTPSGLIYYDAGLFTTYEDADAAKNKIRSMGGYPDDFVVAYYNGSHIPIYKALELLKGDNSMNRTYADLNNSSYFRLGSSNTFNAPPKDIESVPANINGLSNPISNIHGLFYSVQVGVYGHPVTSAQLFDITPLYDRKLASGNILYISGTFQSVKDAMAAKNEIVNKGIKDAFVVAYNDGKELTIYEARNLATNNAAPLANTTATTANLTTTTSADKTGIVFKVQLGAFTKDVPAEVVNQLLDLVATNGLEHGKNDEGLTVYTTGNFTDMNSANELKASLVEKGIKDAFVTAYQHGNRISVTKAIELLN